ncbi:unnamed protein product [Cuscuta epithymum]|uniref:Brf1 TBP-binding domain-containing protein n=1 Tax=Cuscuta epithymum TaxID=186058 RepID=A0AAV0C5J4_9ASTE|nr:unnamed protein product [Cuscuta epithymum]
MVMMWCDNCGRSVCTDNSDNRQCCTLCGKVLTEDHFVEEVTVKNDVEQSQLAGSSSLRSVESQFSASWDGTLKEGKATAKLKNSGPAKTAAEATQKMLSRKRSLLVNFDVLESLFDETPLPDNNSLKKSRNDDISSNNDDYLDGITNEAVEEWTDESENVNEENYAEPGTYDFEEQYDGNLDGITDETTGEEWTVEREYVKEENCAEPGTYDYEEQYDFEDY